MRTTVPLGMDLLGPLQSNPDHGNVRYYVCVHRWECSCDKPELSVTCWGPRSVSTRLLSCCKGFDGPQSALLRRVPSDIFAWWLSRNLPVPEKSQTGLSTSQITCHPANRLRKLETRTGYLVIGRSREMPIHGTVHQFSVGFRKRDVLGNLEDRERYTRVPVGRVQL